MAMRTWVERTIRVAMSARGRATKWKRSVRRVRPSLELLECRDVPATVNLAPSADGTLYQDPAGQLSNGAGQHFYVGDTNQSSNDIRRGAIKFNLSGVPVGSTIVDAALTVHMSMTISASEPIGLHRALQNWGEGTSNAGIGGVGAGEGDGTQATTNDVTWVYTFFNTQKWTTPGGNFLATASATTSVGGVGSYQWTGPGLIADVQQWVNHPTTDFGWVVLGNETAQPTAKQFDTQANGNPANRPVLTVEYTPPVLVPDLTITKSHAGIFKPGDSADTYTLTVKNVGAAATDGSTVTVTDTLPAGLTPTAVDTGTLNGWTLTVNGQTVTATRSDVLAKGSSYPPVTVTVSVANDIARSVVNTATVAGGGEVNTANDTATDPTATIPLADLTISARPGTTFHQGDVRATYIITVRNIGPGPTVGAVTLTDTLPSGLAPTLADNGVINGWTVSVSGQTITATRSDVLGGGSSYPVLTVAVSVAPKAPARVTNTVQVSGGGEINTANDDAVNVTAIFAATSLQRRRGA
jgi:uncharacterized repeat protein (TIGR01451 family)/fimbrial isopeptide formation D2 family protein